MADRTLFVLFDLLGEKVDFQPGQYFWVTLLDPPYEDEKGPRRHISVTTSPNDRGVLGLATRLRDSAFKRSLAELEVGAEVEVEHPKGDFVLPAETDLPYVFVAGGIGITVFRSMLLYISEEDLPHRVTLVYSNRDRASAAFLDELTRLASERDNIDLVLTMTQDDGWDGETRVVGPAAAARPPRRRPRRLPLPARRAARDGRGRHRLAPRGRNPGRAHPPRTLQRLLSGYGSAQCEGRRRALGRVAAWPARAGREVAGAPSCAPAARGAVRGRPPAPDSAAPARERARGHRLRGRGRRTDERAARLDDFRGESRFTTWAYKFALLEAAVKLRKRAWQGREVPLEPESWSLFTSAGLGPEQRRSRASCSELQRAIDEVLTPRQRRCSSPWR